MFLTALFWIVYFISLTKVHLPNKVRKKAKIRNPYNQAPHLTQDTTWERNSNTIKHHIQEGQEVSPCPGGDHKAAKGDQTLFSFIKKFRYLKLEISMQPVCLLMIFSTLYTTLPHNLIKDRLIDLIERTFQREGSPYLACNGSAVAQ